MNTIVVAKKEAAKKRIFKGKHFDSLTVGKKNMVCKMDYQDGDFANRTSTST